MSEINHFYDVDLEGKVTKANATKKKDALGIEQKSLIIDIEIDCRHIIIQSYNPLFANVIYNETGGGVLRSFKSIDFGEQNVKNLIFSSGEHIVETVLITHLKVKYVTEDELEKLKAIFTLSIPEEGNKANQIWNVASLIKEEGITFQISKPQLELELKERGENND